MATSYHITNRASNYGLRRKNDELLRIVMVGKTGAGKSATGNTILGRKYFESKLSATSMTVDCSKGRAEVDGQKVAVIDTPGLFDTRVGKDETAQHLSQCISFAAPGPHVFLVIIRLVDRYTEEEKQTVQNIQELFGEAADKYSMVLFTHGDQLEDTTIEEFLDGCPDLQELVARCNRQYHVFNNKVKDRSQVIELLQKIRQICRRNTGSYYTNEMFQQAERAVEEKKQHILRENEEQRQREKEELQRKYEKRLRKEMKKLDRKFQNEIEKQRKEGEEQRRMEMQGIHNELQRERQGREQERMMEKQHMYEEMRREREVREAEMRRERDKKEREIENMKRQLVEANKREQRKEIEKLQNKHETEAREKAENSNPFLKLIKGGKKVVDGVVEFAGGVADVVGDGVASVSRAFKNLFF